MGGKVGENPAALRAAVFSLSSKNLRGGGGVQTPPPSRARVNIREYSHQTVKQWLHQTVKMATSPLSASAAATFREKAGPVQLFSASPRSLPSATFGGDFCCFGVREGGKSLHFR